jgi:hypothetical protein
MSDTTNTGTPWSEEDFEYLKYELRRDTPLLEIAAHLKRDVVEVETCADRVEIPVVPLDVTISRLFMFYLPQGAFDADVTKLMDEAFHQAVDAMGFLSVERVLRAMVERMADAARQGERDVTRLRGAALRGIVLDRRGKRS